MSWLLRLHLIVSISSHHIYWWQICSCIRSYEAIFEQHLQNSKFKKQKASFNLNFCNIDYVLSMNNPFDDYIEIYPKNLSSNIPESPAFGVVVSQLICYARVCSKYEDFLFRVIETGIFFTETWLLFGNSMVVMHTDLLHKFEKKTLCHICGMICSLIVTYDWFPVILDKLWWVPHVG